MEGEAESACVGDFEDGGPVGLPSAESALYGPSRLMPARRVSSLMLRERDYARSAPRSADVPASAGRRAKRSEMPRVAVVVGPTQVFLRVGGARRCLVPSCSIACAHYHRWECTSPSLWLNFPLPMRPETRREHPNRH